MKKKILLSSILTIVLCLSLIAGTTYALFTSEDTVNISVTSAKINVLATVDTNSLSGVSVIKTTSTAATKDDQTNIVTFENGGTATWDATDAILTLDRITPGDFATFTVSGTNESNVTVRYRYVVKVVEGSVLTDVLTVKVNNQNCNLVNGEYFASEEWKIIPYDSNNTIDPVTIAVGLADTVGNGYTDDAGNFVSYHDRTVKISVTLEAVQGNGFDANGNLIDVNQGNSSDNGEGTLE